MYFDTLTVNLNQHETFFFSWWVLSKREIYIVEGPKQYKSSMDLFSSSGKARGSKSPLYLHLRAHLSSTLKKKRILYLCCIHQNMIYHLHANTFWKQFFFFFFFFYNFFLKFCWKCTKLYL